MALNSANLVVGANADAFVAPVGTAAPVDIATALNAAFINVGVLSVDGASISPNVETEDIVGWQSFYRYRTIVTGRDWQLSFTMLQFDAFTLPLALGGGTVTTITGPPVHYKYVPPAPESVDERAFVLQWKDGSYTFRLHAPRVMAADLGEVALSRSDTANMEVTFNVLGTTGADPLVILSNHPGMNPA